MFTNSSTTKRCRFFGKIALLAALSGVLASCGGSSSQPAAVAVSTKVASTSDGSLENKVFRGINAYRNHRGLSTQTRHRGLDQMAREHARDMLAKGKLEHTNYEYREGIAVRRYQITGLEENILRAFHVPEEQIAATTVKGWIESRGHRINLETMNSHVGIGIVLGADGSFYAVHLTGSPIKKSAYNPGLPRGYGNVDSEHELMW
jgi:uncharacterized protein YkwD